MYWSVNGELVCIATEDSFFVLKYDPEAVIAAKDNPESVTEDGIESAFDVSIVTVGSMTRPHPRPGLRPVLILVGPCKLLWLL